MPSVIDRMKEKLKSHDQQNLKRALYDYMLEEDLAAEEVKVDNDLVAKLLPILVRKHSEWNGVDNNIEFMASSWCKNMLVHLRN